MRIPPLFVSFPDLESFLSALLPKTRESYAREIFELTQDKNLPPVVSERCLAVLFGYSPKFVKALRERPEKYYRIFTIRTGKKKRKIQAPKVALKVVLRWLAFYLSKAVLFDEAVHGFVKGKSHITAAKIHCNSTWICSLDIKDFFQSTPKSKVKDGLISIGYQDEAADIISSLSCYGGYLAQGSPASPFLSNLVFMKLDTALKELADRKGINYTRYADDITFSGIGEVPDIISEVSQMINQNGWEVAESKTHEAKLPHRLKVHGLLVHGKFPRLTKGYRNRIRAYKHLLEKDKIKLDDCQKILGHISYAKYVDKCSAL